MHKKYSKFLIVSFVGIAIFSFYSYLDNKIRTEAASSESSLTSTKASDAETTNTASSVSDKAAEDTAFLMKLASLTKIKIDTSLFSDKSFQNLKDNNIRLEPVPYGRTNPFAPTEKNVVNNKPQFSLKTNVSSAILDRSAVVSGTLIGTNSDNIYFQYGTTETFGKVTPKVTTSLVGNFSYNINLLTPKTTYFYRAVANVNGVLIFGDTMSFTTK